MGIHFFENVAFEKSLPVHYMTALNIVIATFDRALTYSLFLQLNPLAQLK